MGISVLLSVLVKLLHELHKLSICDLVSDSRRSMICLLLGVTSSNGERCGQVVSKVQEVKWCMEVEEDSFDGKVNIEVMLGSTASSKAVKAAIDGL